MKILWITSFRGFKKKSRDTSIQIKFLKEISRNKNIDFCVTQFGEANVKEQLNVDFKVLHKPRREGDTAVLIASNDKARKVLNFSPKVTQIKDIISSLI